MTRLFVRCLVLASVVFAGCSPDPVSLAGDILKQQAGGDKVFARVAGRTISHAALDREYRAWVRSNFPQSMWTAKYADKDARREYGEKIAVQTLLAAAWLEDRKNADDAAILLGAALRDALAECHLRSLTDLSPVVNSKPYQAMDDKMVLDLYKKNKQKYDDQKITEKAALDSLRLAMFGKKKEILERYLYTRRLAVIQDLMRRHQYDIIKEDKK